MFSALTVVMMAFKASGADPISEYKYDVVIGKLLLGFTLATTALIPGAFVPLSVN
jgi:hypothetical protein